MSTPSDPRNSAPAATHSETPINVFRHRWETPMVVLGVVVAVLACLTALVLATQQVSVPNWIESIVIVVILLPLGGLAMIRYNFWKSVVDSVEVTEDQYPELYAIFLEQLHRGGFSYRPRLYITNGNGALNAFASKRRRDIATGGYVFIYSDIVDTFYELGDVESIRFIISHELGHIRLGHVNVRRLVLRSVLGPVLLGKSFSRAQEYSADRFGAAICGPVSMRALAMITAGKRNYQTADLDAYIDNDSTHISRFWVGIINFRSTHAVGRRRLAAARQMDREGWQDVHGKMF